jgi:hypothetical protein
MIFWIQISKKIHFIFNSSSNLLLKKLILSVFGLILVSYDELTQSQNSEKFNKIKLTQNQSLQMLFDLRFLFNLFDLKSFHYLSSSSSSQNMNDDLNKNHAKKLDQFRNVCSNLESLIDPFDYDICNPFMQSNITKSISRSLVI